MCGRPVKITGRPFCVCAAGNLRVLRFAETEAPGLPLYGSMGIQRAVYTNLILWRYFFQNASGVSGPSLMFQETT